MQDFPLKAAESDLIVDSRTGFCSDLISFMQSLGVPEDWIHQLYYYDFSGSDVYFVASVPGNYSLSDRKYGFLRVGSLVSQLISRQWKAVNVEAQVALKCLLMLTVRPRQ